MTDLALPASDSDLFSKWPVGNDTGLRCKRWLRIAFAYSVTAVEPARSAPVEWLHVSRNRRQVAGW